MKEEIIANLITDRIAVLKQNKVRLEERLTDHVGDGTDLPDEFAQQQKGKLTEIIKEIKILEDEETKTSPRD